MNKDFKIGKFTLESLTTGMYANSRIIFREYIQNSSDAIDEAIKAGLLSCREDGEIRIKLNKKKHTISIRDNGSGISQSNIASKLCDIGNSAKRFDESRGFRGIGRLGGLSYCDELKFVTSSKGEPTKSVVCWDCTKLKQLLQPGIHDKLDLSDVIAEVVTITFEEESSLEHYFEVILAGVDLKYPELLDTAEVNSYLSQVAPIPFNAQRFPYYSDKHDGIKQLLAASNKPLEEYYIYINDDPNPIYKPYKTWLTTSKGRDDITQIKHFIEHDESGQLLFLGWYGISTFQGYVQDRDITGFRVRKNNIQIGDEKTLDDFFTQPRFNRWFIGEIYIYDKNLIPNARRDDFEKNESYFKFKSALEVHTRGELSKIPSRYSAVNSALNKIESSETELALIETKVKEGVSSDQERAKLFKIRDQVKHDIEKSVKELEKAKVKFTDEKLIPAIDISLNKSHSLEKRVKVIENDIIDADYNQDNEKALSRYSKDIRKVIYKIFEVLDKELDDIVSKDLHKKIIQALTQKKN